jgi:hypothetical protein
MLFPLLLIGGAGSYFGHKWWKTKQAWTPERKQIFEAAMNADPPKSPDELRGLAEAFRKEGLTAQATLLEKRAALREAPADLKAKRKAVFTKAMQSNDPKAIRAVADAHEQVGAVGAAEMLRLQADTTEAVKNA